VHDAILHPSRRVASYAYSNAGSPVGICVRQLAAMTIQPILRGDR
jgi:hypothetical protein